MQKKHVVESMVGLVELSDIDQLLIAGGCTCPPFGGDRLPDPFDVSLPGPCDPLPGPYGDEFPES
jgi:hypothetical protein